MRSLPGSLAPIAMDIIAPCHVHHCLWDIIENQMFQAL
jgi:hypothetical protein